MANTSQAVERMARNEAGRLADLATRVAGFDLAGGEFAQAKNIVGLRAGTRLVSARNDSLTIFARDEEYGPTRAAGAYAGSGRTLVSRLRGALRAAGVPLKEVAAVSVLDEMGQQAELLGETRYRLEDAALLARIAVASRSVEGIPVWSSRASLSLTGKREVGELEIHWPEIPKAHLREAALLNELASSGWAAPAQKGARTESIEAGIIHSPAVGFFMDLRPALRVVYQPEDRSMRRKLMLYVDRHGEPIEALRSIVGPDERPEGPRKAA